MITMDFRRIIILILIFTAKGIISQTLAQELKRADIPGGKIIRAESFDGSSLWGYIDGGADIYLEYGFDKVFVQEIQWQHHHFKIDIYQMKDEEAAFGIFSISRHKCLPTNNLPALSCLSPYQLQVAHGKFYISIINDNGTLEEQTLGKQIALKIIDKSNEKLFRLPLLFLNQVFTPHQNQLKYFRGKLGIQNGFPQWDELFDGIANFSLYLLPIESKEGESYIAQIEFSREIDKLYFYKLIKIDPGKGRAVFQSTVQGTFKLVKEMSAKKIIYFVSNLKPEKYKPFIQAIDSFQ